MKIHKVEQNSVAWSILRSGKITASELDALISPLGEIRKGEGVKTYLAQKLCEQWMGGPLPSIQGVWDLEQGKYLEERAKPAFTFHTGIEIKNVGFITDDAGHVGCSPDAMFCDDKSGVEIKCPRMENHIGYLLSGKLPKQYIAQVQCSMFVTGFPVWHFFSYRNGLPPLHLVIERDDDFHKSIKSACADFLGALDVAFEKLVQLNGGLPTQRGIAAMPNRHRESLESPEPNLDNIP
jgi:exodeoxyribonuclease (lambda-induced)